MTWSAQVRHVVAKDLRESWKLGVLYVATVLVASALALGWASLGTSVNFVPILVGVVGALLTAAAVQSDSPTRVNAFWASHPLNPSSVASAKLVVALLIVLFGMAGQFVAVQPYHVQGAELARAVAWPACVFAAMLVGAMVLAAVTADLRSWLLSVIALPVAMVLVAIMLNPVSLPHDVRDALLALLAAGALAVFAWAYRSRGERRRSRVAAYGVVGLAMLVIGADSPERSVPAPSTAKAAAVPLSLERWRVGEHGPWELVLDIRVPDLPAGERLVLRNGGITVLLRDGRTLRIAASGNMSITSSTGATTYLELGSDGGMALPRMDGISYRFVPSSAVHSVQLSAMMMPEQRRAISSGIAGVVLDGTVLVFRGRVLSTMPLTVGATLVEHGRRLRIEQWSAESGSPLLVVHSSSLDTRQPAEPIYHLMRGDDFVLVSPMRHEAIPLRRVSMHGTMDGLVLPASPLATEIGNYSVPLGPSKVTLPDADWYRGAQLSLVTQDLAGSYPVRLELRVP
jgi:hypothetical protein